MALANKAIMKRRQRVAPLPAGEPPALDAASFAFLEDYVNQPVEPDAAHSAVLKMALQSVKRIHGG